MRISKEFEIPIVCFNGDNTQRYACKVRSPTCIEILRKINKYKELLIVSYICYTIKFVLF